jgi:hypothetical protein
MHRLAAWRTRLSSQGEPSAKESCHGQTWGCGFEIDLEAALADRGHGIGCGRLDPVDLVREQRRGACIGLRHRQHHHACRSWARAWGPSNPCWRPSRGARAARNGSCGTGRCPKASAAKRTPGLLGSLSRVGDAGGARLSSLPAQCVGEAMNKLVRLIGRKESGSLVVSSTVRSSILRASRSVGMRDVVTPTWLASKCGADPAIEHLAHVPDHGIGVQGRAIVELHAGRSLNTHLVLSLASTAQEVAKPGISTLGAFSVLDRIPVRERVVHGDAGEAVALETLVRLTHACGECRRQSCQYAGSFPAPRQGSSTQLRPAQPCRPWKRHGRGSPEEGTS